MRWLIAGCLVGGVLLVVASCSVVYDTDELAYPATAGASFEIEVETLAAYPEIEELPVPSLRWRGCLRTCPGQEGKLRAVARTTGDVRSLRWDFFVYGQDSAVLDEQAELHLDVAAGGVAQYKVIKVTPGVSVDRDVEVLVEANGCGETTPGAKPTIGSIDPKQLAEGVGIDPAKIDLDDTDPDILARYSLQLMAWLTLNDVETEGFSGWEGELESSSDLISLTAAKVQQIQVVMYASQDACPGQ